MPARDAINNITLNIMSSGLTLPVEAGIKSAFLDESTSLTTARWRYVGDKRRELRSGGYEWGSRRQHCALFGHASAYKSADLYHSNEKGEPGNN
jgi:hypothetical protein